MNLERAKALRDQGLPWPDIARRMKTTIYKLRKAMTAAGYNDRRYNLRNRKVVVTAKVISQAIALQSKGMRWKAIGKALGLNWHTIWRAVNNANNPKAPPDIVIKARELRAQGMQWKSIGRALDVDAKKLSDLVRSFSPIAK